MSRLCDICGKPMGEANRPPLYGAVVCDACAAEDDWDTEEEVPCSECGGSGRVWGQECEWCLGTGVEDY
jgi:DnaJ-class molecular chaperone